MSVTTRPAWATETTEPEVTQESLGYHTTMVPVGDFRVSLVQYVHVDGTSEPLHADLDDIGTEGMTDCDAQQCRDLAAALLEAARVIEAATS